MKKLLSKRSICFLALTLSLFASCKKDDLSISISNRDSSTVTTPPPTHGAIYLKADNWQSLGGGDFVCNFHDFLKSNSYISHVNEVSVMTADGDSLISNGAIRFMEGELWSFVDGPDLKIHFRALRSTLPFDTIYIKVSY